MVVSLVLSDCLLLISLNRGAKVNRVKTAYVVSLVLMVVMVVMVKTVALALVALVAVTDLLGIQDLSALLATPGL